MCFVRFFIVVDQNTLRNISAAECWKTDGTQDRIYKTEGVAILFCRKCGQLLPEDAVFCANCGARCVQPGQTRRPDNNGYIEERAAQPYCGGDPGTAGWNQQAGRDGGWNQPYSGMPGAGAGMAAGGAGMAGRVVQGAGKAAGSAFRAKIWIIIAAALVAIAAMLYFLFFKPGKPEDTIQKMEDALNQLDQDALLECFDEQTQGIYSGMLGVGGDLLGVDLGAMSDLASGLGGYMAAAGMTPEFELSVADVEYTGDDTCLVTVDMAVSYQGETETETQVFPMVKDGREWVISAAGLQ